MMGLKALVIVVLVGGNVFFAFAQDNKGKKVRASADTAKQTNAYDKKGSETIPDTSIVDPCIIRLDEIDYTKDPE